MWGAGRQCGEESLEFNIWRPKALTPYVDTVRFIYNDAEDCHRETLVLPKSVEARVKKKFWADSDNSIFSSNHILEMQVIHHTALK